MINKATKIENFRRHLSECLRNGTCGIIDQGLAQCHISGNYCNLNECPKPEGSVTQTANKHHIIESHKYYKVAKSFIIARKEEEDER